MYRIYTRTGDKGTTGLFGGSRIDKDDICVEAYGTVDELISQLGVCYASAADVALRDCLHAMQKTLFVLGAELASDEKGRARLTQTLGDEDIEALEQLIDRNMALSGPLKAFVIPGKNLVSAQLHVARTLARRLERILTAMARTRPLRDHLRRYANRLSDALFSMARVEETTSTPDA
ncbi:cob(I)yrinic acid a,c-diamide adenosyltransferase [Pluralibacter gergoviae]|uniref:cob(I)yrinic acid a,c-diamide adenosyltransferase n=1 Tax=Pluralibacter gergoviae TaxID=61647 RepID=UPI0006AC9B4F|nr:cob(I)yrinic acid a,c-diamide adenosyltransferase [Pluralibacter gergoviae]ELC3075554.1 cob(I)yrinic acid a,c-diamide adenosyltransferase [Pluralibacter gergoviae]KOR00015.1 ATP--cobalamin adenosyltransferase [Pluralibacter gergoviae]HDS1234551.1 cob(I)yrinic acid a,c-diamide adenosyltransferase [Pluralibacter gergoviae]HDS1239713.1 cob(I)yrinic acid a,c-diamide adenosyltransferase [Pluralibacter gergoviae]HDS1245434.1 cob(I)yrinic acid a,c-diamide adenosyltransferase [Pluralibacter gergovi